MKKIILLVLKRRFNSVSAISPGDALLMESGDFLLLESGDKILLEA